MVSTGAGNSRHHLKSHLNVHRGPLSILEFGDRGKSVSQIWFRGPFIVLTLYTIIMKNYEHLVEGRFQEFDIILPFGGEHIVAFFSEYFRITIFSTTWIVFIGR